MAVMVAPSLLSANFLQLGRDVEMVNQSKADLFHLDIMDGHFVPNITFGFSVIEQIKSVATKPLDVHLMISNPDRYIDEFSKAGADWLSVHYETCNHLHRTLSKIKECEMKAGVVLNPHNPISLLADVVAYADYVLLMSVNPGFGGQAFIQSTYSRLNKLAELREKFNPSLLIEVDGGVCVENAPKLVNAGANILVAGNAVFSSETPSLVIEQLKNAGG